MAVIDSLSLVIVSLSQMGEIQMEVLDYANLQKEEKKKQVILVAAQLFLEKSISDITMTEVANECEIGVASLYRYFSNKKKLVIEIGTYLWQDFEPLLVDKLEVEAFKSKNGYEQLEIMGNIYISLYLEHSNFINFIYQFDAFVVAENITKEELEKYEQSIVTFYKYFENAIKKGQKEQVIRDNIDIEMFYLTATHSLMLLSQKLSQSSVLNSNDTSKNIREIRLLVQALLLYAKA